MIVALLATVAVVVAVAEGCALSVAVHYQRRLIAERERERADGLAMQERSERRLEAARNQWIEQRREQMAVFEDVRDELRQRAVEEVERVRGLHADELRRTIAHHEEEMNRMIAFHSTQVEKLMNAATYGPRAGSAAEISEPEPDAEMRARSAIMDDSIEAGAQALKAEYEARGIHVSLEEVREEARSMLLGVRPREEVVGLGGFLKDGPA